MKLADIPDVFLVKKIEEIKNKNYMNCNFNNDKAPLENFKYMISNYLEGILEYKFGDGQSVRTKFIGLSMMAERMVEHLTGDYNCGLGEQTFEEMDSVAEKLVTVLGYADTKETEEICNNNAEELAETLVDGNIMIGAIPADDKTNQDAMNNYSNKGEKLKKFFQNAVQNMVKTSEKVSQTFEKLTNTKGLNAIKSLFNAFEITFEKRHFVPVQNSIDIQQIIEKQGLIHFASPDKIEKILESGALKSSKWVDSYFTKGKTFFFPGVPKFEDILINGLEMHDVMTAVRIKPTKEQMNDLKYRALNDNAVVKDGEFKFTQDQIETVYYGLKYDKEKDKIFLDEITEKEAKDYKVPDEVKNLKINKAKQMFYMLSIEQKHHQKVKELKREMKSRGLDWYNVSSKDIFEKTEIQEDEVVKSTLKYKMNKASEFIKLSVKEIPFSLINSVGQGIVKDYERSKEKEGMAHE